MDTRQNGIRQVEFEQIAMPHVQSLLRVARRLTLYPDAAEDLVQETMLLAWRGFHQFERGSNARAWLFRILLNGFYAQVRKAPKLSFTLPAEVRGSGGSNVQQAAEISEAFLSLSTEHRAVLMLSVVEGFTCRETAGILDVPVGTVMSRLSRARQELRDRLGPGAKKGAGECGRLRSAPERTLMNCADVGELTPLYLAGELDAARASGFEAHLERCDSCARAIYEQREIDQRLRSCVQEEIDATPLEQTIRRRIAAEAPAKRPMVARWLFVAASIAGLVLVADVAYRTWYPAGPAPVCVDAALDHRREIVDRQPRTWLSDPAAIAALAERQGIPAAAVAALSPTAYHLERGRLCFLDKRVFLHLVYTKDGREFSAYLRPRSSAALSGVAEGETNGRQLYLAGFGPERIAFFQTDRLTAVFVAEQSGEEALALARTAANVL